METAYPYFISGILPADAEIIRQLIIGQVSLSPTFSYLTSQATTVNEVDGFNLCAVFSDVLSVQAAAVLNGIFSGYLLSVPVAKSKKLADLQTTIQDYIDVRYSIIIRTQLMNLYTLAVFDGLTNRAAYIRPGIDWLNSIISYTATTAGAIQALTTVADVQSYVVNIAGNVGPDPHITVSAAVLIMN